MAKGDAGGRPYYRRHVFCCTNVRPPGHERGCCHARDGTRLRNYMKARAKEMRLADVRINASGCLDRCELGPVMVVYPEGAWYSCRSAADVDEVLGSHVRDGIPVERLLLPPRED